MITRRKMVAFGMAAVALSGIAGGLLITQGSAKISLSADSNRSHHDLGMGSGNGMGWGTVMGSGSSMGSGPAMGSGSAMGSTSSQTGTGGMLTSRFTQTVNTLDNQTDPTFNQLLGINNRGVIAGYFGSGAAGHPNKGYLLSNGSYINENFPGSVQTQVTGLNDRGVTVGFWSSMNTASQTNANYGFYSWGGHFFNVNFPTANNANPPVNQLLGVNNFGWAVGFFTDANGNNHGYAYNVSSHRFRRVTLPRFMRRHGGYSLTAAGINNRGDVTGFYNYPNGKTFAFLETARGTFIRLAHPGASMTQAFGVNDRDEVVGAYTIGTGNNAKTYGFTWRPHSGGTSVSAPQGMGTTIINGVDDFGDLVGFYTDAAGKTHGLLILSRFSRHHRHGWMPSPTPSVSPSGMMTTPPATMSPAPTAKPPTPAPAPSPGSTSSGNHW